MSDSKTLMTRENKQSSPSKVQRMYLMRGIGQPGGKLPLFDLEGQRYKAKTIQSCIKNGWCEKWCDNPINPDWLVCKLTEQGKAAIKGKHDA